MNLQGVISLDEKAKLFEYKAHGTDLTKHGRKMRRKKNFKYDAELIFGKFGKIFNDFYP